MRGYRGQGDIDIVLGGYGNYSNASENKEQESKGFLAKIDMPEAFEKKKMDFGLPEYESIRQIRITEKQLVVLTETGKIYRQLYEDHSSLQEIDLPQASQQIFNIVSNIFSGKLTYEPIEQFFLERSGTHCLLNTKNDQTYYWNAIDTKIKTVLPKIAKEFTALVFDDTSTTENEFSFLFGTKNKELFYAKIIRKKTFDIDFQSIQIEAFIPKQPITHIFLYNLDHLKTNYTQNSIHSIFFLHLIGRRSYLKEYLKSYLFFQIFPYIYIDQVAKYVDISKKYFLLSKQNT